MANEERAAAIKASIAENYGKFDAEGEREFINELINTTGSTKKAIPEPVFKEIFLPFFTGEKTANAEQPVIQHWMGLVGSPTAAADVVDIQGNILFEVPPMYDTTRIDNLARHEKDVGFARIFGVAEEQARVHVSLGKAYVAEELTKKLLTELPENATSKYSWRPALEYYGLIPKETQAAAQSQRRPDNDDDLVFDDD